MDKHSSTNIGNPHDHNFEDITNDDILGVSDNSMAQYESYEKFDVDSKAKTLKTACKKMIVSLCDIYLQSTKITNDEYVKAVAEIEEQNLFVLMKQVQYSEHVIDSLMRQLDSGGYVDKNIYSTIREMQKSAIQITLEISKYTRNLPEYFKFVARDVKSTDTTEMLLSSSRQNMIDITAESISTTFNPMAPQRGMREMMLEISDVRKDIDDAIKKSTIVEATPISVDDDSVYDDRLEDDIDDE